MMKLIQRMDEQTKHDTNQRNCVYNLQVAHMQVQENKQLDRCTLKWTSLSTSKQTGLRTGVNRELVDSKQMAFTRKLQTNEQRDTRE